MDIWREDIQGSVLDFRLRSHCFALYDQQTAHEGVIGFCQFDDLGQAPRNFFSLLVDYHRILDNNSLPDNPLPFLLRGEFRGGWREDRALLRYILLILEKDPSHDNVYRRVGIGIATWHKAGDEPDRGLAIHKLTPRTRLKLV